MIKIDLKNILDQDDIKSLKMLRDSYKEGYIKGESGIYYRGENNTDWQGSTFIIIPKAVLILVAYLEELEEEERDKEKES